MIDNFGQQSEDELVCHCFGVFASDIKQAIISQKLTTVEEVVAATNAGAGCQSCRWRIQELLDEVNV